MSLPVSPTTLSKPGVSPGGELSGENFRFLVDWVHRESGIALGDDKRYLLESRLAPILAEERLPSLDALCLRLRSAPAETLKRRIVESMTTHETLFFRDTRVFDALRSELFPELIRQRQAAKSLRIWSAACSSGQEAYSLAMLLFEMGLLDWNIEIVGTDISTQILDRARSARYYQIEMNRGLPAPLLVKYFQRSGLDWQVKDNVRRVCKFSYLDLRQSMAGLGKFDLALCRNVLIYFDMPTRKKILTGIRGQLNPGGYLLLGSSENTFSLDVDFERKTMAGVTFYQNPAPGGLR